LTVESATRTPSFGRRWFFAVGTCRDFAGNFRLLSTLFEGEIQSTLHQYICDKFAPTSKLYPSDPQARAIVNHRLCFNSSFFYSAIAAAYVGPLFFDYPHTEMGVKRVHNAVNVLEEYFKRLGKKYVAGDDVTIADISLACSMTVLEVIQFDFSKYPLVQEWYATFKKENPGMWEYPSKVRRFLAS
jgi:glutathione S-transferase